MDTAILDDILECAVCFRTLDENNKALPCQHTFCTPCLEAIVAVQKELRCPECRVLISKAIDELPPNVLLIRLLDGLKNQQKLLSNTDSLRDAAAQKRHSVEGILSEPGNSKNKSLNERTGGHERMHSNPETTLMQTATVSSKQPSAKATFAYNSSHEGDLKLKKGDKISLLRWVDTNWLVGECGSRTGLFPANHVNILVPLPDEKPHCRALYDFKSTDHEKDRDCLIFNKDDTIYVLRRVDENWGEGILNDEIGIFPLSFVKMNSAAKKLIDEMSKPPPNPTTNSSTTKYGGRSSHKSSSESRGSSFFGAAARRIANSRSKNDGGKQRHSFPLFGFGGASSSSSSGAATEGKKDDVTPPPPPPHRHSMELEAPLPTPVEVASPPPPTNQQPPPPPSYQHPPPERKQHAKANSYEAPSQRVRTSIAGKQWLFTPPQQGCPKSSPSKCEWNHSKPQDTTRHKTTSRQLSTDGKLVALSSPLPLVVALSSPTPLVVAPSAHMPLVTSMPLPPASPGAGACMKQPSPPPRPPRSMGQLSPRTPPQPQHSRGRSVSPRPINTASAAVVSPSSPNVGRRTPQQRSKSAQRRTSKDKKREKALAAAAAASSGGKTHGNKKTRASSSSSSSPFYYELNLTSAPEPTTTTTTTSATRSSRQRTRDRYYAVMSYPANGPDELDLHEGDVIVVHERRMDGWFCGTHLRSGKIGHFPATFVERIPSDE